MQESFDSPDTRAGFALCQCLHEFASAAADPIGVRQHATTVCLQTCTCCQMAPVAEVAGGCGSAGLSLLEAMILPTAWASRTLLAPSTRRAITSNGPPAATHHDTRTELFSSGRTSRLAKV